MSWLVPVTTSRKQAWRKWAPYWCCVDRECGPETRRLENDLKPKAVTEIMGVGDGREEEGLTNKLLCAKQITLVFNQSHPSIFFSSVLSDGWDTSRPAVRGSSMCLRRGSILAGIPGPTAGAVTPLLHSAQLKWYENTLFTVTPPPNKLLNKSSTGLMLCPSFRTARSTRLSFTKTPASQGRR